MLLSSVNEGSGIGSIQTVLVIVSSPQLFPTINETSYVPGIVNSTSIVPEPHVAGLLLGLGLPKSPFISVHPELGEIIQLFLLTSLQLPKASTTVPFIEVFVKLTIVLTHTTVSGEIIKSAIGLIEVVIGPIIDVEIPHGFAISRFTKKVLGILAPDAPHDVVVNK